MSPIIMPLKYRPSYNLSVGRYWRIYRTFFVTAFQRELEFRANFFAKVLQNATWVAFTLLILGVLYSHSDTIGSWTRAEANILFATSILIGSLFYGFFFSLMEIPEHVRKGTLDFIVAKPIDPQFWISVKRFSFDQFGSMIASLCLLITGLVGMQVHPNPLQYMAYLFMLVCALAIFYSLNLFFMTLAVWFIKVENFWALGETIFVMARTPGDVFSISVRRVLTYVFPLVFLASAPAQMLAKGVDVNLIAVGFVWAAAMLVFSRHFLKYALRSYSSASS